VVEQENFKLPVAAQEKPKLPEKDEEGTRQRCLVSNTTVKSILSSHPVDQKSDGIGQIYGR
jgi:hypothetical protein